MLCVLLLVDTFKLLDAVSNALDFEDVIPEGVGNLDVVPLAFEKGCVVRYGVIRVVGRGNLGHKRKLLDFLGTSLKVGEWRLRIEKFDALYVLRADRVTPVGIEDVTYHARLVGGRKADVACLLADDAHNATGILIEDDHADAKAEVAALLKDFGWADTLDLGGISMSRYTEMLGAFWVAALNATGNMDWGFKLVR